MASLNGGLGDTQLSPKISKLNENKKRQKM